MTKSRDFDDLEEYVEYDAEFDDYELDDDFSDNYEYVEENEKSDDNYEYSSDDSYEDDNNYEEVDSKREVNLIIVLGILSNWFIKLGIVLAICLLIMFFVTGKVMVAFIYVFGLIVAFSFGYVFMFCIDHFLTRSNKIEKF